MQEAVLLDTIDAYAKNLQLTQEARYGGGVASKSDITLAQTQLDGAKAQATGRAHRAIAVRARDSRTYGLARLPAALAIGTDKIGDPPPSIPLAVPSQLLERRPDIAANERLMAAANANVGLAEAAYYPTLTLSAALAFCRGIFRICLNIQAALGLRGSRRAFSYTVFDFDAAVKPGVVISKAAYDAAVAGYRETVLSAFQEVEDDLANLRYLAEEAVQQREAVTAAQEALDLEIERYKAGTDSELNVITTQTIALTDQQTAINILERRMAAAVDLIKALGGG